MSDASNRQIAVYSVFVGRHAEHRQYFLACQYGLLQSDNVFRANCSSVMNLLNYYLNSIDFLALCARNNSLPLTVFRWKFI